MAERSVESTSSIVFVIPGHRVVISILTPRIGRLINGYQYVHIRVQLLEVVHLICPVPYGVLEELRGRVSAVHHMEIGLRGAGRVTQEISAGQLPVPVPIVFRISGGMDTNVSSPRLYVSFKSRFLSRVENIPRGTQKNDRTILPQVFLGKAGGILCGVYLKPMGGTELFHSSNPSGD